MHTLIQPALYQLGVDRRDLEHGLDRAEHHEVVDRDVGNAGRCLDLAAERQQTGGVGRGVQRVLRGARQRLPHPPGDPLAHAGETDRWRHEIARADHATHSRAHTPDLVAAVDQAASGAGDRRRGAQLSAHVPLQDAPTGPTAGHRARFKAVFGRKAPRPRAHAPDEHGDARSRHRGLGRSWRSVRSDGAGPIRPTARRW